MIEIKKVQAVTNAGLETVLELERLDCNQMNLEISNAVNALAAMELAIKVHKDGTWQVIADDAGDYAAPVGFMWSSDTGFFTLGVASGFLVLDNLESVYGVRIRAQSGNAAGSIVTVLGQMGAN